MLFDNLGFKILISTSKYLIVVDYNLNPKPKKFSFNLWNIKDKNERISNDRKRRYKIIYHTLINNLLRKLHIA